MVTHKLLPIKENSNNLPPYKFEGGCSCGFQCKFGTEEATNSQLQAHLQYHGTVEVKPVDVPKTTTGVNNGPAGAWRPQGR